MTPWTPDCIAIDFETMPIEQRPAYPPKPVGVSIQWPAEPPFYYGWDHGAGGNNCTHADAGQALHRAYASGRPLLFHNAKFDTEVARAAFNLAIPPWERIHDTMILAFLLEPHARSNGLKPLAESWLDLPPDERDAVADWVWEHRARIREVWPEMAARYPISKAKVGPWIWAAPADVVAPYANGDTDRTSALFKVMWPLVERYGLTEAYDRERRLMPILQRNEREGMRCDVPRLQRDLEIYQGAFATVEAALRKRLQAPGLNFDADADVASVLYTRKEVPEDAWSLTKSGKLSVSKKSLRPDMFADPQLAAALGYRNRLQTCLSMFMEPWLHQARATGGTIHTNWNQTRGVEKGGTRTGRPSTDKHNFLNISKEFGGRSDGYRHPDFLNLPALPLCRRYVLPDAEAVFLHRDFDGQELRVFGHFEQGALHHAYQEDPALDPHAFIGAELMRVARREMERGRVKVLNFQSLYGGGVPALQRELDISQAEAKELKNFHDKALPGRKILVEEIKRLVATGLPIRTWGGRLYFPEEPRFVEKHGRVMDFEYKLINYLVQGSAADLTKEAILAWDERNEALPNSQKARFLVTVYDEINISAPIGVAGPRMADLKVDMEAPRLTVPMRSSGKKGPSWGELEKCP